MAKVACEYSNIGEYTCKIISQSLSSQQPEVDGNHWSGNNNSDVEYLIFNSCTFDKFPRNLHELFPNLSGLWIGDCKLESISRDDIRKLRGLRTLWIDYCGLKCLQGDLLRDLKQLESVSFEGNQLGEIEPDILDGLQHLTFANFVGNATINMRFDINNSNSVSLDALKAEIKLKCKPQEPQPVACEYSEDIFGKYRCQVSAQKIVRIQVKFAGEHKVGRSDEDVDELCFENCTFVELPRNLHELFPKLSTLRMQNCTLGELKCEQINKMKNLSKFCLQNCNFKGDIFNELKHLTNISLQGNQTEDAEVEIKNSKKISKILSDDAFKDFTINVGDSSFKIHKFLFAAHSTTLAEIFKNNPEAVELNLQDVPDVIFKVIYDFIYSEKLPENFDNWTELFVAANRLKIDDLVQITAEKLQNSITDANAQSMLELTTKFNIEDLRERAFEHLTKKHFPNMEVKKELSREPEKLRELIEAKLNFEREQDELTKKMEKLKTAISQS